ncbi:MAG: histidine phosphatase family protein [Rhodocyclaceae bacterium]|nr:histidine phosphatase family protein [Rhodocyclaceae bacterium]
MQFHLIRHPRTVAAPGVCYGSTDLALAEDPAGCARRIGALLPPDPLVISSPASRCLQLARMLHSRPRIEPRLREIHFGDWEMQAYGRLAREAIDAWATDPLEFRPPQGETASEMLLRVRAATEEILELEYTTIAIVAHGGPLRAMAGVLLGLATQDWLNLRFDFGRITCIDVTTSAARLVGSNR